MAEYLDKFRELTALNAFVLEFQGKFEEVLDVANEFKKYAPEKGDDVRELDEYAAHIFLEKRGETLTVKDLRDYMKVMDLDKSHSVAFIEYLLFKYKKTLKELFNPPGGATPEALAALEAAIANYQAILAKRRAREERMKELEKLAAQGGVKGLAAKNELEQMKREDQLEQNRQEITAAAQKRKAEKAAQDGSAAREAALKAEQQRLEEEKRRKEEEELRKRQESRNRLAARAAIFQGK